jgi:GNAT superfamily N-acetyltransferase
MQHGEALRLHQGLGGVVHALFAAFGGGGLELSPATQGPPDDAVLGMVTTPMEFVPAAAASGARLEVHAVQDLEGLEDARQVAIAGDGSGPLLALYEPEVAAIPGVRIYVGRVEGRPVTTATGWTANAATGIFQVATPPAHRRRGYGGAVTSRAVLDGFAAGADLAWLQPSPSGERLYRKLGFRKV